MGDFNIHNNSINLNRVKLNELCPLFDLEDMTTTETCITKIIRSTIDFILTNNANSFPKSATTETGLSNFHKFINVYFKATYWRLLSSNFFFKYAFLEDLNKVDNPHESYTFLTNTFPEIVERNPSMKMIYK